jgi:putative peptide zinc metalloprotease protein
VQKVIAMPDCETVLPRLRPDLLIRPLDAGRYVVKDSRTSEFFHLGEAEHFLLTQFDGSRTIQAVRAAYAGRMGESISEDDLAEFVESARSQGLLQAAEDADPTKHCAATAQPGRSLVGTRTLLHWRLSLWDPDRLFTWLAPRIRFFWTPAFLVVSVGCIFVAGVVVWANRHDLAGSVTHALRWETAVVAWLTMLVIGTLHECAHGLTCKHHGGEVHEIGFLLLYLMPCFYCNVSDAWLFREKSKRLWVTFAGAWFELFIWAIAVLVWRLTVPGTLVHRLAFVVLSLGGVQTLLNFNPLMKLDGYYLLSDWLEIPNLRQQALDAFRARVRWLLWGSPSPKGEPGSKLLGRIGLATWLYSAGFLASMLWALLMWLGGFGNWFGVGLVTLLGLVSVPGVFQGFCSREVGHMIRERYGHSVARLVVIAGLVGGLWCIRIEDRTGGTFEARCAARFEVRAPATGFLRGLYVNEGDHVSSGAVVARLEIPDLASRLAQKRAEAREARAKLALLALGTRPEELAEQRQRVQRAKDWHDRATEDLARQKQALVEDLACLDHQIAACRAELTAAQATFDRDRLLLARQIGSRQDYEASQRTVLVCRARLDRAEAEARARQALGTLQAEVELVRRQKEWADAAGALTVLEAGNRPEQLEAARAGLEKLEEEARYLDSLSTKQELCSPLAGLVTTARLKEKTGQFVHDGDLICVVEDPVSVAVEIAVAEQDGERIEVGQQVALKARALPFTTLAATVDRIAPSTGTGGSQSTVTVHARLTHSQPALRPGATGYARIYIGPRPIGEIAVRRVLAFLRTEFWW